MTIIYGLFSVLDFGIYSLVSGLFNLIFDIASIRIFEPDTINGITVKIYVILSVVVIFKVTIACIQYLINPDTFSDKEKGMGGILKKVLISLALIAVVPVLFDFAREIQEPLSEAIPEVILGTPIDKSERDNAGDTLARITLLTFVSPRLDNATSPLSDGNEWTLKSFTENVNDGCTFWSSANCKYNYQWYFSIPVGIFLVYILLSMGIDIAVRTVKLAILEILAPVCISSYIMKKDTFNKWYKTCFKVYADLFIRIAIVYFIIFFVSLLASGQIGIKSNNIFAKVFLILGVLFFAKNAPKFICDVLGLDSSGDLKDMFTPFHKKAGGAGAMLAAPVKSAVGNYINTRRNGEGVASALKRAALGAVSSAGRATVAAVNGKGFKDTMHSSADVAMANANRHSIARLQRLQDKKETNETREKYAAQKRDEAIALANSDYQSNINKLNNRSKAVSNALMNDRNRLQQVNTELNAAIAAGDTAKVNSLTAEKQSLTANIAKAQKDMVDIGKERANYATQRDAAISKANDDYGTTYTYEAEREIKRNISITKDIGKSIGNAFGVASERGSDYIAAADLLKSGRSSVYTGEAMTKLTQNPNVLTVNGNAISYTSNDLPGYTGKGITYSQMEDMKVRIQNGEINSTNIKSFGFNSVADANAAYTFAQKKEAIAYINANLYKEGLITEIHDKNGAVVSMPVSSDSAANSTITEWFKRMEADISGLKISEKEKKDMMDKFHANPGEFMKNASDMQERIRTKGTRIQSYEQVKKDKNGGNS